MAEKSRVLVIGRTCYLGKFIVKKSAKLGHPTFALVKETTASDPQKSALLKSFKRSRVTLLHGDLYYDHKSLVEAISKVDVVFFAVKVFVDEEDIASYTIKAIDDPRALNSKIRPPKNILSFNEVVTLWEDQIGKSMERI